MCLGIPGRIIEVDGNIATVEFWGTRKRVRLDGLADPVAAGDYIVSHSGFAERRIAVCDVADTLALYEVVLCEADEEPIELSA